MTTVIWLAAMSFLCGGRRPPSTYYYPQAAVLIHDFPRPASPSNNHLLVPSVRLPNRIASHFVASLLLCDLTATVQIAKWVYQQTEKAHGQVWVEKKVLRHLGPDWSKCFAA
jgi:hypothetical protein